MDSQAFSKLLAGLLGQNKAHILWDQPRDSGLFSLVLCSPTNIVSRSSDAHSHILGNLNDKIPEGVLPAGLSTVELLKCIDEFLNALRVFLHIHATSAFTPTLRRAVVLAVQ